MPNGLDPPEHAAFRAIIDPFFTPARMRRLGPRLRAIAAELVAALPRGVTVDAVTGLGYPLAVRETYPLGTGGPCRCGCAESLRRRRAPAAQRRHDLGR